MVPKTNLNICLSESVVFLRGSAETTVTGRRTTREAQPAMVRGLLILTLDKPTKISSIEITLEGKSQTAWPEGAGARRLEVTEEHEIFSATTVYFRAGKVQASSSRRTASVGPGLAFDHDELEDESFNHELRNYRSDLPGVSSPPLQRLSQRRVSMDCHYLHHTSLNDIPTPPYSPPNTRPGSFRAEQINQSISMILPHLVHRTESWMSNGSVTSRAGRHIERPHLSRESSEPQSSSSSIAEPPLSRRESHDEPETYERSASRGRPRIPAMLATNGQNPSRTSSLSMTPISPLATLQHPVQRDSASSSAGTSTDNSANNMPSQTHMANSESRTASASPHRDRGRRHARFSLAIVSSAILDAVKERVRSSSPRPRAGKERAITPGTSRDHSPEGSWMSRVRSGSTDQNFDVDDERGRRILRDESDKKHKEKERSTLGRIGDVLGLDPEGAGGEGAGWKEFRKGTYTYPISFAIPGDSPPSLQCDFGTVSYRLKATVHRPGAFTHRLTASREVTLIASPGEDDVDETDNIVVQREWDSQMHYLIIISGRSFPIGSAIPIHVTFMPIAKVKIFRISAFIEEKVEYFTQFKHVARTEAIRKFELLSARYHEKDAPPLLPLTSDFMKSPLRDLVDADDDSEAASTLMGPGPWSIQASLQLPKSCKDMHFTNRHKRSNIAINHTLKIVFRVERGDDAFVDAKTGNRKHFDIVVQTPLHILSCWCNPDWISLPRYTYLALDAQSGTQSCPCLQKRQGSTNNLDIIEPTVFRSPTLASAPPASASTSASTSHHSPFHALFHPFDSLVESPIVEVRTPPDSIYSGGQSLSRIPSDVPSDLASLYRRNTQFARLVAGQESEAGDPPPQYEDVGSQENARGAHASATAVLAET